ncbi:MAG: flavodoxin family protein [Spirochaetia bacterium]
MESALNTAGGFIDIIDVHPGDIAYCTGCLWCWHTGKGRCRIRDRIPELEERIRDAELLVFLSPIHFGTMSSPIKSLVDKGLGCKQYGDGFISQFVIGYGEDATAEERTTFLDIILLHRGPADIVHPELAGIGFDAGTTSSKDENSVLSARVLEFACSGVPE